MTLIERLRHIADAQRRMVGHCYPVSNTLDEAADEIERLCVVKGQDSPSQDKYRDALINLLPDPALPWREEGNGMIAITVHKSDLRAARAVIADHRATETKT